MPPVLPESEVPGLSQFLDTLKFDANGMLVAIVQVKSFVFLLSSFVFSEEEGEERRREKGEEEEPRNEAPASLPRPRRSR